jgi:hypothetical protein
MSYGSSEIEYYRLVGNCTGKVLTSDFGPQAEVARPQHCSKQKEGPDQQARRKGQKTQGAD